MKQSLIALDQFLNAFFFRGWADETLSARAYRNASNGKEKWQRIMRVIDTIFFWEPNHCEASFRMEQNRLHLPSAYRTAE